MFTTQFDRRRLLTATGLGLLAVAAAPLAGCSSGQGPVNAAQKNLGVKLPTYRAYTGVAPDLPGTSEGVLPAFYNMPKNRAASVKGKPGTGQSVSGMANIFYATPPGADQNPWLTGLNDRLGANLDMTMVPAADYSTKFATTIAGNDLPDMMLVPNAGAPNLAELLKARFTDLTEYLSGDAILEYPNLANIVTQSWKGAVYNGGIYGIPIPRGLIGGAFFIRQDLFEKYGANTEPRNYNEFVEMTKALTDPKERRWCYANFVAPYTALLLMNGAPNNWREDGGKLTRSYETEEFKQTLNDLIELWKSGVMHPDTFSTTQPEKALFNAGTTAVSYGGYTAWTQFAQDNRSNPDFKLALMPSYERTSGQLARWWTGNGLYSINAFKKQDNPERTKLLLRICDYLAAPFGSEEHFYRLYGQEGRDHTLDANGNPVLTQQGQAQTVVPIRYLADSAPVLYEPGRPKDADAQHAYQSLEIPKGITDPTLGLYSNAFATKNATIDKTFTTALYDIVQGRKPFNSVDDLIETWRKTGGDAIRGEFEDQLQKN